jgi:hypothetical protein
MAVEAVVNFNWDEALDQIFSSHLSCPRCGQDQEVLVVGYSRKRSLSRYAPRHTHCADGDDCDARKLITLCTDCAQREHLRGEPQDASHVLVSYLRDCRRELDDSLAYMTEGWQDELEADDPQLDETLEAIDPDAFREHNQLRTSLENEYLRYHRALRARREPIPDPGWRSEYVEEVRSLGYKTLLGD